MEAQPLASETYRINESVWKISATLYSNIFSACVIFIETLQSEINLELDSILIAISIHKVMKNLYLGVNNKDNTIKCIKI